MRPETTHAMNITEALQQASMVLKETSPTPRLDAEVLVMHVCRLDRAGLIRRSDAALTGAQERQLQELLARRQRGEPVAYLTGVREFWSMELNVSAAVLIPRPETELLVEKALERIPRDTGWTIADLGTGSGAIGLAVARERPHSRVIATDVSPAALAIAKSNAARFGLTNIEFRAGDWDAALAGDTSDMILSNPPYIWSDDPHLKQGDVRFEPPLALEAGPEGLDAIRHIALHARQHLKPGGWLLFEHGRDQAVAIGALLHHQGYRAIVCHRDLSGHDRVTECRV
jgi:release factor glutamine methyltransferase